MKKEETFISVVESINSSGSMFKIPSPIGKIKSFIYKLRDSIKLKARERIIAPVKNHSDYIPVRNYIIDFISTLAVLIIALWSFGIANPLRKGLGAAIVIALAQYYIVWYYSVNKQKPREVVLANESIGVNVRNSRLDVRVRE